MRIYSKFTDYYDSVLNMFQGEVPPVYHRKTEVIETDSDDIVRLPGWSERCIDRYIELSSNQTLFKPQIVGFAGKLYPYVVYERPNKDKDVYDKDISFMYDPKEIDELVESQTDKNTKDYFMSSYARASSYEHTFSAIQNKKEFLNIFEEYKVPIFHIGFVSMDHWHHGYKLTLNDELKPYKFASVLDPYTAMQELHMYLNNVMVMDTQVDVPVGSDEVIRDSKGFYDYSFKTLPGGKKRRKNK